MKYSQVCSVSEMQAHFNIQNSMNITHIIGTKYLQCFEKTKVGELRIYLAPRY